MMDLKEAAASIESYTLQLDSVCMQYRLGIELKEAVKDDVAEYPDVSASAIADLNRLQREVHTLRGLIEEASGREADRLLYMVEDFVTLLNAKKRNTLAFKRATEILNEHQKRLAEEREKAEAERRRKIMESGKPKTALQLFIEDYRRQQAAKNPVALDPSEKFKRKYPGRNIRTQGEP